MIGSFESRIWGDEQDPAGRYNAGLDRKRRASADDPCLAGARAGEDYQRPARGLGSSALSVVQAIEQAVRIPLVLIQSPERQR